MLDGILKLGVRLLARRPDTRFFAALMCASVLSLARQSAGSSPAFDSAADPIYNQQRDGTTGWVYGSNGGYGWGGPWQFGPISDPIGFVGSSATNGNGDADGDGDINTPRNAGGRAWGFSVAAPSNDNPGGGSGSTGRLFQGPLSVGQTFSIDMDNGFIANVVLADGKHHIGSVGWSLAGPDPITENFGVVTGGLLNNYLIVGNQTDFDSGIPMTTEGIHCEFTLLPPVDPFSHPRWRMVVTPLFPGAPTYTFGGNTTGSPLDRFGIDDIGAGSDPSQTAYFNNISVTGIPEPGTAGLLSLGCAALLVRRPARHT